jgi:hypothetical protein
MLNTIDAISRLLEGNVLEGQTIHQLEIPESDQFAFLINVDQPDALNAWSVLRSLLSEIGRYPVLTEGWGSDNYFSRFYYLEEVTAGKLPTSSPEAIIASAPTADLAAFLTTRKAARAEELEDALEFSPVGTHDRFGAVPERSQIDALINDGTIQSHVDLEWWLLNWELEHFGAETAIASLYTDYLDWFVPNSPQTPLLLLPTEHSWECLAYLHWYGACSAGTTVAMSFLKQWHQVYGAELVCHYGTILQFTIERRPTTMEQAFQLAWEQEALAECTTVLPGVSLRDHARSLLVCDRWFLHERP